MEAERPHRALRSARPGVGAPRSSAYWGLGMPGVFGTAPLRGIPGVLISAPVGGRPGGGGAFVATVFFLAGAFFFATFFGATFFATFRFTAFFPAFFAMGPSDLRCFNTAWAAARRAIGRR
jgi:hypothetical protein